MMESCKPKTRRGRIGYICLWVVTCLILAAMAVVPVILFVQASKSAWGELVFLFFLMMISLYMELLALLKAIHYLVRRRMGTMDVTRRGDVCHVLYAILGLQCLWPLYPLLGGERLVILAGLLYYLSGVAILILGAVDLTHAVIQKHRRGKQARVEALASDRLEWERRFS